MTGKRIRRLPFILKIAQELRKNYLAMRIYPELRINDRAEIKNRQRRKCQVGKLCKGNKRMDLCDKCRRFVCGKCVGDVTKSYLHILFHTIDCLDQ